MLQYKRHQRNGSMLLKIIMQRMYVIRHYLEHLLPSNAALMLQYSQQDGCQEKSSLISPHYLKYWIENNTWTCGDMEFIFECSHRYQTSEHSEQVRYQMWTREDKFHISKRPCMVFSVYYINKNQPFHKPKPCHIVENPINVFHCLKYSSENSELYKVQ